MRIDRLAFDLPAYDGLLAGHYVRGLGYGRKRVGGTDDWLLVATLHGEGRFGDLAAEEGTLTLVAPGTTHDYGTARGASGWEILWVHFHPPSDWLDLLGWPALAPGVMQIAPAGFETLADVFREVVDLSRSKRRLAMNALERLLLLCQETFLPLKAPDERIVRVLEAIESNLRAPLSLADLSALVHLSPSRFSHLFREEMGIAPREYVIGQRMQRARTLLERTPLSIGEIAAEVGMEPFHFSARFKEVTGLSPRGWRALGR